MNIYWGMARSEVAFAYKSGAKVVSKLKEDGDGGWCEDEKPEFNWEEYEYSVIVDSYTPKMPTLDVCIPNQINGREKMIRKTSKEWIRTVDKDKLPNEGERVLIAILYRYSNAPWKYSKTEAIYKNGNWYDAHSDHSYRTPEYWRPWPELPFVEDFGGSICRWKK